MVHSSFGTTRLLEPAVNDWALYEEHFRLYLSSYDFRFQWEAMSCILDHVWLCDLWSDLQSSQAKEAHKNPISWIDETCSRTWSSEIDAGCPLFSNSLHAPVRKAYLVSLLLPYSDVYQTTVVVETHSRTCCIGRLICGIKDQRVHCPLLYWGD